MIRRAAALTVTLLLLSGSAAARIAAAPPAFSAAGSTPADGTALTIDADHLDGGRSETDGVVIFSGAVVARDYGWLLTADHVTVYLDERGTWVRRMVAIGNVCIATGD